MRQKNTQEYGKMLQKLLSLKSEAYAGIVYFYFEFHLFVYFAPPFTLNRDENHCL